MKIFKKNMFASKISKKYASKSNTYHQNKYYGKKYDVRNIWKNLNLNLKKSKENEKKQARGEWIIRIFLNLNI